VSEGSEHATLTPSRWTQRIVSTVSTCVLVGCVAWLSEHADGRISAVLDGQPLTELSLAGGRVQHTAALLIETVATYSSDHTPLVLFGLGALALVGCMTRTT
jgi:hypothetical protein